MTTLPSLTRTIDDAFVSTWYEIRKEAIDNILDATVVWTLLKEKGCMVKQVGGEYITRTIRYGTESATSVKKGDTLSQGEPELKTMARWDWKYISSHVQRSVFDDQKNNGKNKIASLVDDRLKAAREALVQAYETDIIASHTASESGRDIQSLNDLLPPYANANANTFGGITRPTAYADGGNGVYKASTGNTWWGPKYKALSTPMDVNLLADMKKMFNATHNNQVPPDIILTTDTLFELYEDFALDAAQVVKNEASKAVDLGFQVLKFKGADMTWAPGVSVSSKEQMLFLNSDYIEVVYDPELWFSMTNWKDIPLQGERIAHILCACNLIGTQPRRHGRLYES